MHSLTHAIPHGRRWRHRGRDRDHHGIHRLFHHGRGGRTVRRGNVRFAILSALKDQPMHGYQLIQDLEKRTEGRWRPSAGSIYPTLQLLEDEGLLASQEIDGRRTYSLTDKGRQAADENPLTAEGWREADAAGGPSLPELAGRLVAAAAELERIGDDRARDAARQTLVHARKRLYQLLADDDAEAPA
ncbi:MAG: PadR family transcriptional regulator [Candidatus Limnocylindria bacterium]